MKDYQTVSKAATFEYVEQRSRFISTVIPVSTEKEAVDFISDTKQKYWDARHNVYAYVLKEGGISRYSDDGEPHSTAGLPTLEVIKKKELYDVCVVTTRYFGGILLGTGGLVRAYTTAANGAILEAGISLIEECDICSVGCPYSDYSILEQLITQNSGTVEKTDFTDTVTLTFFISSRLTEQLQKKITDAFGGKISLKKEYKKFLPTTIEK